ncbi:hypothetical protein DB41_DS00090 [Neochlamydia sp. TUME1]|uniref:hypothetical protein n=1 Tax=Neochlamydia sp. TUME1 TaxID=1478174 RepID=UPI00057E56E4|nr:hypothetical protein [Neochlamydia sp. TUME1]KIC76928.1 hypothetical protein DB41_DS00090 [Neochlamydia sp. TUME1]
MDKEKNVSTRELQAAIKILESFSYRKETSSSVSILKKTMTFAKQLFSISSVKVEEKKNLQQALALIKNSFSLIQSLAEGTFRQKQIASSAYTAIDRFNALSSPLKRRPLPWRRWMDTLLIKIPKREKRKEKISLGKEVSCKFYSQEDEKIKLPLPPFSQGELLPTTQEIDAFRMKAITLLKHHEVRFTSLTEQLNIIREMPIVIKEQTPLSKAIAESVVALEQTISSFPGETIELKGTFKRSLKSKGPSIPIPESFHITTQSQQTGYPHPSQHHGWVLSPFLLPKDHALKDKMQEIANELKPTGRFNLQAKAFLKAKQECFNQHVTEFLSLHLQLNECMLKIIGINEKTILNSFYKHLFQHNNPYHYLSYLHQIIIHQYLEKRKDSLKAALYTPTELEYIYQIGNFYEISMEKHLNLLEELALKQLHDFLMEIEKEKVLSPSAMYHWLKEMLLNDINFFSSNS